MEATGTGPQERGPNRDRVAGALIAFLGTYIAIAARDYPFGSLAEPGPGFVPFALGVLLGALGLVIAIGARPAPAPEEHSFADLPHALVIVSALGLSAVAMERLGFRITVALLLVFFLGAVEHRPAAAVLAVAFGFAFGAFYLVNDILRVPLPLGPWGL